MSKPRSDRFEASLTPDQVDRLRDGLATSWSYEDARNYLRVECGLTQVPNDKPLRRFYDQHCRPHLQTQAELDALRASGVLDSLGENRENMDEATFALLSKLAFAMASKGDGVDLEAVQMLGKLLLEDRKVRQSAAKVEIDRDKMDLLMAEAKANQQAREQMAKLREGGTDLTQEDRDKIIEEVDRALGRKK